MHDIHLVSLIFIYSVQWNRVRMVDQLKQGYLSFFLDIIVFSLYVPWFISEEDEIYDLINMIVLRLNEDIRLCLFQSITVFVLFGWSYSNEFKHLSTSRLTLRGCFRMKLDMISAALRLSKMPSLWIFYIIWYIHFNRSCLQELTSILLYIFVYLSFL